MKLIKIGKSSSCDIVLNSDFVSAIHAEMIILDDGNILLLDKNSTNGTFVNEKRIVPGQDVSIRRGMPVRFADVDLVWSQVPQKDSLEEYTHVYHIGSNYRNDIVLKNLLVSRFHASLRIKGHEAFIHDNGSKNGVKVNGEKIPAHCDFPIKRGDIVVCADEDISTQIQQFIPTGGWIRSAVIAVVLLVVLACGIYGIWHWIASSRLKPEQLRESVVYVRAGFHYEILLDDDPMELGMQLRYPSNENEYCFEQATAFFIDEKGMMGTNRHVAVPWEYRTKDEEDEMRQLFEEYMLKELNVDIVHIDSYKDFWQVWHRLSSTRRGILLLAGCKSVEELRARIARYRRARVNIKGVMDFITVGYPGHHYTHVDEFQRCFVVTESGTVDKDVAILQLNDKQTPSIVKQYLSMDKIVSEDLVPMKDRLYTIGYPNGIDWGLDITTKSLEPNIRETKCSKVPGKYSFEFQASSVEGSSGSPVFNERCQLVGILSGGYQNAATIAVKACFLKELYDEL